MDLAPATHPEPGLPRRPVLLPGLRVLRRGPAELQVGLDPALALVLPDTAPVRNTLAVLGVAGDPAQADPDVLARLHRRGLLIAQDSVLPKTAGRVELVEFGAVPVPGAATLLEEAGLGRAETSSNQASADVGLLIGVGEPDRDLLDGWVRDGLPHLVVRISEGTAVIGPFVDPGHTACLRCVDAHRADLDRRWPLLVAQHAEQSRRPRADAVPDLSDPTLLRLAEAWAVRDLLSFLARRAPATWSATLRLSPDLADIELASWLRHPECGCSWDQAPGLPRPPYGAAHGPARGSAYGAADLPPSADG